MPSEQDEAVATASRFVATLGATMAAENYPVTMVREVMAQTSRAYGLGAMLNFGPSTSFLPWMLLMLLTAYGGQWIGNQVLGSYGRGLLLIVFALAVSHRPNTPPAVSLILPGFWLLVPGSLGFMGITELIGTHSSAIFTATLISMMSIAIGVQTGLLLWRKAIQLSGSSQRRAKHD